MAENQTSFHSHLLLCGGVREEESVKKKKGKKRGHGGGLKSTVRMLQKGQMNSPKERKETPKKKESKPIPLVPIHNRTTRFKEIKKKEARKLAAKERRLKSKQIVKENIMLSTTPASTTT